jgi:DNA topoisomerase I
MGKSLVIVESPSKSITIGKYLGSDYKVVSSKGHIRDLSTKGKFGLGVDIDNNFKPDYVPITGKTKVISELKSDVKDVDHVYLASDPDREGEAIAWHLYDTLKLKDKDYDLVVFNEITKDAVKEGIKHPRKIDMHMVNSQETRRILDRIIGFRLSKLMQAKTGGTSAGRVQSVALKLVVDREREIEKFVPVEYWTITGVFPEFSADLYAYNHKNIEIHSEEECNDILNKLDNTFKLESVDKKEHNKKARPPFITSTLQQDASNKLGFPAKKTMSIAQRLYEGIDIGTETVGLITYMRTDSIRISNEFVSAAYKYIESNYGEDYVGYVKKSTKTENVQDAHEAIRPTSVLRTPDSIKNYLDTDDYKLYKLIYSRALASVMADAKVDTTTINLDNNNYQFKATGSVVTFPGYLKVYQDYEDTQDVILPDLSKYKSNVLIAQEILHEQHFTKPPVRYTEAKLIKELEELGIGRPSTYASIMDNIKTRNYVKLVEKKFVPTDIGFEVTDKLQEFFKDIINVKYTANMETELDEIAEDKLVWYEVLDKFYKQFEPEVKKAFDNMEKKPAEETGEMCPECGSPLVYREGKYGKFVACSNYPKCKYVQKKTESKEVKEIIKCPTCKDGMIIERRTKKGKIFYGCSNYPKCKTAYWDRPTGDKCPNCGEMLVNHNGQIKCSSCDYTA